MKKDGLAVGIAGARNVLANRQPFVKKGTLTCSNCKSTGHTHLFLGGKGACCHKPQRITSTYYGSSMRCFEQCQATLDLRADLEAVMKQYDLPIYKMAGRLGLKKSTLSNWFRGQYGEVGQRNMIKRISPALARLISGAEDAA